MPSSLGLDRRDRGAAEHAFGALPAKQGMYNPAFEKDACGLAMVATLRGEAGHDIIDLALTALRNLEHRGAIGSDAGTWKYSRVTVGDRMLNNAKPRS